jgi:hypothetical protein
MSWTPGFEHPALPSPALREHYESRVKARLSDVNSELMALVLDGLGELALSFAVRPLRAWEGKAEDLARKIATSRAWPEATAIIELAARTGLLVSTGARDVFRPADLGEFTWLGARLIAATSDRDGLMDYRLNGCLFDMFAMAAAMIPDPDGAAGVVELMAQSPGPFEDLLELGSALAAAAVAWGASATPGLRGFLTERALSWTQPMGADWNREVGTAALVIECQRNDERDQLLNVASEIATEIVQTALADTVLADSPLVLATLDTALAMLVAGMVGSRLAPGSGAQAQGLPRAILSLADALPPGQRHRVALALGRVLVPGPARDGAIVELARHLGATSRREAILSLERANGKAAEVATLLVEGFAEASRSSSRVGEVRDVLRLLRTHMFTPPDLVEPLVALVIGAQTGAELRISAAAALSYAALSDEVVGRIATALESSFLREDAPVELTAGAAGALLWLGGGHPRLGPTTLALIASELAPGVERALIEAFDCGLRAVPSHMVELIGFYRSMVTRAGVTRALVRISDGLIESAQRARDLGPFSPVPPLADEALEPLASALLELAADASEPLLSAESAVACASLLQGDETLSRALVALRAGATDTRVKSLYDLALGASRALTPEVMARLGRDAAHGEPEIAAAACVALRLGVETFLQAQALDAVLPRIRERVEESGPHDVPALQLIAHLATLPLGIDPR